ncbi:cytochrome C oxidase copper chaperone-domain-containing protein [Baffinella frigidus]|nr:cytochrome C oxidase copper chaperone-domain-containing protein [Cryptophyta sp. CCMP2293]
MGATASAPELPPITFDDKGKQLGRFTGKKICCSCPDTKGKRDECVVQNGEPNCVDFITAHKDCLRKEGFTIA